ncbi:hypothetical protein HOG98_01340 [bacterium]|nr:hypothetical protein [bacterium]
MIGSDRPSMRSASFARGGGAVVRREAGDDHSYFRSVDTGSSGSSSVHSRDSLEEGAGAVDRSGLGVASRVESKEPTFVKMVEDILAEMSEEVAAIAFLMNVSGGSVVKLVEELPDPYSCPPMFPFPDSGTGAGYRDGEGAVARGGAGGPAVGEVMRGPEV